MVKKKSHKTSFNLYCFRIMNEKDGLLHDDLLPEYEKLGVLGFAEGDSDYELSLDYYK